VIVSLNGEPTELSVAAPLAEAVAAAGADKDARGVAVAVDGEVVPRAEWDARRLAEGDEIEVVRAVQGG
jgi:sulfur carrier protein